jgi:hypothetical protein
MTRRESTIKHIVPNLRFRWPNELKEASDDDIASVYEDFAMSDDHGNNDQLFPTWFDMIPGAKA